MVQQRQYDVLIIGGGQAGIPLAHELANAGRRVALAERKHLGGSCVNFGCSPTKAAIASAHLAHLARRAEEFGLRIASVEIDFPAVLARARSLAERFRQHLETRFEDSENPQLLRGHARLEGREGDAFRIRIDDQIVLADRVVLNTGTRTLIPPIEGLREIEFLDSGNWLYRPELPEHLALVGGSYIGLEMGQFYRRMGSRVTVIEESRQIVAHEDEDVASALQELLESEGIEFRLNSRVTRIHSDEHGLVLTVQSQGNSAEINASHVFVATGRQPNTDDLGLETVGVNLSEKGIVEVDERLRTNVEGIWAVGDIRGGPMFTHTSWDDYRIVLSQLTGDGLRTTQRVVPYAIFTDPELGRTGMTEREARASGRPIRVGRFEMSNNGKASEIGETDGFIKVVVDAETDRILGAAVLAAQGAELVHMYVDLMNAGAPYSVLRDAIHIHPTLAEAVQSAVSALG